MNNEQTPQDITQDPEYIRGYEDAKKAIEARKSAYSIGKRAAYVEEVARENRERELQHKSTEENEETEDNTDTQENKTGIAITVTCQSQQTRQELIAIVRKLMDFEERNSEAITFIDERLKKLESYTEQ